MSDFVFYAWQSDLPRETNRTVIRDALDHAIKALNTELGISDAFRADQDTKGVPGDVNVAEVIFDKIDKCRAFVADITTITPPNAPRPSPNPNVLIEYGRASVRPGSQFVVQVFNEAFGDWEKDRPFDLRHRRKPVLYRLAAEHSSEQRRAARAKLASDLLEVLREILAVSAPARSLPTRDQFQVVQNLYQGTQLKSRTVGRIIGFWIGLLPTSSDLHLNEPWKHRELFERVTSFKISRKGAQLTLETMDIELHAGGVTAAFSPMAEGAKLVWLYRYSRDHSSDRYCEDTIAAYGKENGLVALAVRTNNLTPTPHLNIGWVMADVANALLIVDRVRRAAQGPQVPYALALELRYDEQTTNSLEPVEAGEWRLSYIGDDSGHTGRTVTSEPITIGPIEVGSTESFPDILRTVYVKIMTAIERQPDADLTFAIP